jgi:hypothetical protein
MGYILSLGVSTTYYTANTPKSKVFSRTFLAVFFPYLSCLCRLSGSYGVASLNHAAKIIIKQTFCWSKMTNNSFYKVEVAKTCTLRGPHELREWVGRAEASVALTTTGSLVNAIRLPNASAKVLLKWLFSMARMHYRKWKFVLPW